MFIIAVMLASGASLPNYNLPPNRVSVKPACADDCRQSRYRLPSSGDDAPSVKSRALAEDGGQCNLVGAKLCTSKPRRIFSSSY